LNQQSAQISRQLDKKIHELKERKANGEEGLWMFLDSGASRSVIQENSPIRKHLINVSETNGSCNVGNGANLKYLQKGLITKNNEVTVVKDLKYDLYAAVAAAKRGISCVLDYTHKWSKPKLSIVQKDEDSHSSNREKTRHFRSTNSPLH
jgi:hypothetical protein